MGALNETKKCLAFCIVAIAVFAVSCDVPKDDPGQSGGLVACYSFDMTYSSVEASTNYHNHGILINGIISDTGFNLRCLNADAGELYVEISDDYSLDIIND